MQSESVKNIVPALLKAQSEFPAVEKTKINPFFKSRYSDLQEVWTSVKGILHKNGLVLSQPTGFDNGAFGVFTVLYHSSGEWIGGFYLLNPGKPNDPQQLLASLTYARRGALAALLSIVADDENDGEDAVDRSEKQPQASHTGNPGNYQPSGNSGKFKTISGPQAKRLFAIAMTAGWDEMSFAHELFAKYGYKKTAEVTPDQYESIVNYFGAAKTAEVGA